MQKPVRMELRSKEIILKNFFLKTLKYNYYDTALTDNLLINWVLVEVFVLFLTFYCL